MQPPDPVFLSIKEVAKRLSVSIMTLHRWQNDGTFPKTVKIGPHRAAFLTREINEWVEARVAARDQGTSE